MSHKVVHVSGPGRHCEGCMSPSRAPPFMAKDPSLASRPGPAEHSGYPQMDPWPTSWGNPTPVSPWHHVAQLPTVTAFGCKNYLDLLALQKVKLSQITIWQECMFFHRINPTFKHQTTIFIFMWVNSSYNGLQLLWKLL